LAATTPSADHQHDLARLIGLDRLVGHEQGIDFAPVRQAHVAEHPGGQEQFRVGQHGAAADRAGARIEAVVGEIEPALPAEIAFVLQADFDLAAALAFGAIALGLQEQRFGGIKGEVDRIERVDRGQQRGIGRVRPETRLPTSIRRSETRPVIGARTTVNSTLSASCRTRVGGGSAPAPPATGRAGIDFGRRNRFVAGQAADAPIIGLCQPQRCARWRHWRGLRPARPEGTLVDGEQRLSLAHDVAVMKCSATICPDTRGRTSTAWLGAKRPT
jgi:hypothetical protein